MRKTEKSNFFNCERVEVSNRMRLYNEPVMKEGDDNDLGEEEVRLRFGWMIIF